MPGPVGLLAVALDAPVVVEERDPVLELAGREDVGERRPLGRLSGATACVGAEQPAACSRSYAVSSPAEIRFQKKQLRSTATARSSMRGRVVGLVEVDDRLNVVAGEEEVVGLPVAVQRRRGSARRSGRRRSNGSS